MTAAPFDARLGELLQDARWLAGKLPIVGADAKTRLFNQPFPDQVRLMDVLLDPDVREVVAHKPRQIGFTTTNCAHTFTIPYRTPDAVSTLVATNHADTTRTVFNKFATFVNGLDPVLASIHDWKVDHTRMSFISRVTGASIDTMTMGGTSQGRSKTYQRIIGEEVAFWPHPAEGWASVTSAMHETDWTQYVLISTADKPKDFFHMRVQQARKREAMGDPTVRNVFARWADHASYRMTPPESWEPTHEEFELMRTHGLDLAQLYWRHHKIHHINNGDERLFRREYPLTPEEAFLSLDGSFFNVALLDLVLNALPSNGPKGRYRQYIAPDRNRGSYVAAIDPAWCDGGDNAVLIVGDNRRRVCAVLAMNGPDLTHFIQQAKAVLLRYRTAGGTPPVIVEYNTGGGGKIVYEALRDAGLNLWQGGRKWKTTAQTKPQMLGELRGEVNQDAWTLNDIVLVQELLNVRRSGKKIEGQNGSNDDHVMALALLEQAVRTMPDVQHTARSRPRDYRRPLHQQISQAVA